MTTFHNVALNIDTGFELQRCLSPLWKLEMSKPNETCLRWKQMIITSEKMSQPIKSTFW